MTGHKTVQREEETTSPDFTLPADEKRRLETGGLYSDLGEAEQGD
jgi:hypothetical protein